MTLQGLARRKTLKFIAERLVSSALFGYNIVIVFYGSIKMQTIYQTTPDLMIEGAASRQTMPFMHYHNTHELYFLLHGEREYFIEEDFKRISEGDVVFIPKGIMHRTGGNVGSRILVSFSDDFLCRFFKSEVIDSLPLDVVTVFRPSDEERENLAGLFNSLLTHFTRSKDNSCKKDDGYLAIILARILFLIKDSINLYKNEEHSYALINSTMRYINENYKNIRSIEDIAAAVFVSKYYLSHSFTKHLGISVITYLNTVRIKAAEKLIGEGCFTLGEIAERCGFNSLSYFSKVFKAQRGVAPNLYKIK